MFLRRSAVELPHQSSNTCRLACPLYCRKWREGERVLVLQFGVSISTKTINQLVSTLSRQKPTNTHFLQYHTTWQNNEETFSVKRHMNTEQCLWKFTNSFFLKMYFPDNFWSLFFVSFRFEYGIHLCWLKHSNSLIYQLNILHLCWKLLKKRELVLLFGADKICIERFLFLK